MMPIWGPKDQVQVSDSGERRLGGRWSVACPLSASAREFMGTVWRRPKLVAEIVKACKLAFDSDTFPLSVMCVSFRANGPWFILTSQTGGMCVPDYERGDDYVAVNIDTCHEAWLLYVCLQQTIQLVLKDLDQPGDPELAPETPEPLDFVLTKEVKVTFKTVRPKTSKRRGR